MAVIPFITQIDFMNPRWNRDAWARIQADMDSSKQRICHCSGTILAVRPGEKVKPSSASRPSSARACCRCPTATSDGSTRK